MPASRRPPASDSDLPAGAGAPARRALAAAGYTRLEQLTALSEEELLRIHGVGPKAVGVLRAALAARGASFAERLAPSERRRVDSPNP